MIDIKHAHEEFRKYVSNYNPENSKIALKIGHIERVANISRKIAGSLNLSEEEIKLAELIGLFHDLGRFEQVRIANTFSDRDSGINHGELSVKVLFENNLIRNYLKETEYDNIIKKAVLNHNRAKIEIGLSEKELLFAKIIRDADKLDIFYTITFDEFLAIFWYDNFDCEKISDKVMYQFENGGLINYADIQNNADMLLAFYAYVYDLNFESSLKYLAENKYLDTFKNRVKEHFTSKLVHEQVDYIHNIYKAYLKSKNII